MLTINDERCVGCGICQTNCPRDAITIKEGKAEINDDCIECNYCVGLCPNEAIE